MLHCKGLRNLAAARGITILKRTGAGARDEALNVVGCAAAVRVAVIVARREEVREILGGDVGSELVVLELGADALLVRACASLSDCAVRGILRCSAASICIAPWQRARWWRR